MVPFGSLWVRWILGWKIWQRAKKLYFQIQEDLQQVGWLLPPKVISYGEWLAEKFGQHNVPSSRIANMPGLKKIYEEQIISFDNIWNIIVQEGCQSTRQGNMRNWQHCLYVAYIEQIKTLAKHDTNSWHTADSNTTPWIEWPWFYLSLANSDNTLAMIWEPFSYSCTMRLNLS